MTRPLELKDLLKLQFVADPQLSPDGAHLVYVQTAIVPPLNGYSSSLWHAHLQADGSWSTPRPLTPLRTDRLVRDASPRFAPDGKRLLFLSNRLGRTQLWLLPLDGGEALPLDTGKLVPADPAWSPCGRFIAFSALDPEPDPEPADETGLPKPDVKHITWLRYKANGRGILPERPRHIHVVPTEGGAPWAITVGNDDHGQPAWSPDGSKLAFTLTSRADEVTMFPAIWVQPVEEGRAKGEAWAVTDGEGPAHDHAWSPDGRSIAYLGHRQGVSAGANTRVWLVDAKGGAPRPLDDGIDQTAECTVATDSRLESGNTRPTFTADGKAVLAVYTVGGNAPIYRLPLDGRPERLACVPATGAVAAFSYAADRVAYTLATPTNPADVWVDATKVSDSNPWLRDVTLYEPTRFTTRAEGGPEIEGWYLRPNTSGTQPAILEIHGGPAVAYGNAFMFEFQLLATAGYAVVFSNIRGGRGYGEDFCKAVIGDWGGVDYVDIMAVADWMAAQPWINAARMGVTGGSYGGFMTNWIVGHTDRFAAAVSQRSISNMYSKYGTADNGFFGNKAGMGGRDLWDSEDFIMERSPIRYAPKVKTPILLIQSEEDYRCPMEQAEQFYLALKRLGKTVEFIRFAGENHELSRSGKPANRLERLRWIRRWFDRYLQEQGASAGA